MEYLKYSQKVPLSLEQSWEFFSSPSNLKIITPKHLGFEMKNDLEGRKMYAGQIIAYTIRPVLGIPIEWVTEITHVEDLVSFVDEQRFGPYKFWHHEHRFKAIEGGVEISDHVYYKMPFGILGKMIHSLKVRKDLEQIFAYRKEKLIELFGDF